MKFYTDDKMTISLVHVASANTYISSVAESVIQYIISAFPKNYFRSKYIDTMDTFVQRNDSLATNASLPKKTYPNLSVSPQISFDTPFTGFTVASSPFVMVPKDLDRNYKLLLEDPEDRLHLYYSCDYLATRLLFSIKTNTFAQCSDIGYWLHFLFNDKRLKFLDNQIINVEVPPVIIDMIAHMNGLFPLGQTDADAEHDMRDLEVYLAQTARSKGRMHRAVSMTTARSGFYFGNKVNILTNFDNLTMPEGVIRSGPNEGEYTISFSVQATAWHPNAFVAAFDKAAMERIRKITPETVSAQQEASNEGFYTMSVYDSFALSRRDTSTFLDSSGNAHIGQNVIHQIYTFPANTTIRFLQLSKLLRPELVKLLVYARDKLSVNLSSMINATVLGYSDYEKEMGQVDYDSLSVSFSSPIDSDIVLDVFIDRASIDAVAQSMLGDPFFSKSNAIGALRLQYANSAGEIVPQFARIYSFDGNTPEQRLADMASNDESKMLRVMTLGGEIGYVGLVPEGTKGASNVKVCLGKNQYGTNIIRCLELV